MIKIFNLIIKYSLHRKRSEKYLNWKIHFIGMHLVYTIWGKARR